MVKKFKGVIAILLLVQVVLNANGLMEMICKNVSNSKNNVRTEIYLVDINRPWVG